jgi:phage-related protein
MRKDTKPIRWVKAARRAFDVFPARARERILDALTIAAEGGHPSIVKPMKGLGSGVYEVALRHRTDAYRTVHTVQFRDAILVLHAFQKKSKSGIGAPRPEIESIRERLGRLKELLK